MTTKAVATCAIKHARANIGVREIGHSNTGEEVSAWLRRAGSDPGEPWCAASGWCFIDDACTELHLPNKVLRSAYCPSFGSWARGHGILHTTPIEGCIMLEIVGDDFHHFGIVSQVVNDDEFKSIEGNTNNTGAREGIEVLEQTRYVSADKYRFVYWQDLYSDTVSRPLIMGGQKQYDMPVVNNVSYAPIRKVVAWMGAVCPWLDGQDAVCNINGRELAQGSISLLPDPSDGETRAHAPVRALFACIDPVLEVKYDPFSGGVSIIRH